jgi:hypothetical protein
MFGSLREILGGEMKKIAMSVCIIFLCFSSVVGVTWALFTSGNDGKIGINTTSGHIDLDIVDTNGNSLVGDVLNFESDREDGEPIYFEPGATFYTQGFAVKNNGNITINYRLYISNDENENMESFSEAFELWISENPNSIAGANRITEFEGTLAPGESGNNYYLVIKMKETANNDFQGKVYTGIGVTVYAVQGNVDIDNVTFE